MEKQSQEETEGGDQRRGIGLHEGPKERGSIAWWLGRRALTSGRPSYKLCDLGQIT